MVIRLFDDAPTLEARLAEAVDAHRLTMETRSNAADSDLYDYGTACTCGEWNAFDNDGIHAAHVATVLAAVVAGEVARAVEPFKALADEWEQQRRSHVELSARRGIHELRAIVAAQCPATDKAPSDG